MKPRKNHHGFTLIEMAIVLAILALLLAGGLSVLSAQIDQQRIKDTQKLLEDAREALIGYAASHSAADTRPFLPCPDRNAGAGANDGQEDRLPSGACAVQEGNLPWVTLGMNDLDGWGNHLRYSVSAAFSNSQTGIQLTSTGTLTIRNAALTDLATNIPAVIVSHGKNGYGARNASGSANQPPPATNLREIENTNGNTIFISNTSVGTGGTGGEFDDLVVWLSPNILFNRMIQAGKFQ